MVHLCCESGSCLLLFLFLCLRPLAHVIPVFHGFSVVIVPRQSTSMSIPLFPSLRPNISSPFWLDIDPPIDEEAEILELERGQQDWKVSLGRVFTNVLPIGKTNHDVDEEDLDDLADEEDDTTSSDDMEDDDGADVYQLQESEATMQAPSPPEITDVPALTYSDVETLPANSIEAPIMETSDRPEMQTDSSSAHESGSSPPTNGRPSRMIVGRLIPAPRPGTSQQGARAAFIDTAGRPVYSGRTSTGSVSPTSRAYIQAALHSPTGSVHLDIPDGDDDTDDEVPDRGAPTHQALQEGRSSQSPLYEQMLAAGQSIHPSESSTQIDNLIETMHQAQRAHAAGVTSPVERTTALAEAGFSNVGGLNQSSDEDVTAPSDENL
ncbi:uncharacterized protein LOC117647267 [Thrips palmi]|uniref:Uncharacterized protein LOC117647267 n=1 Tax=Thrips palmi TaxID=161013 RepID=A0A6P8ZPX3_THRPL|nr:uncharacterized protein LOC117647267 [Thrips palmi]